jgi:hypothetical protein
VSTRLERIYFGSCPQVCPHRARFATAAALRPALRTGAARPGQEGAARASGRTGRPAAAAADMESLIEIARRPFLEMAPDLAGALVYLDAGAAEVAQLSLGPAFLFGAQSAARVSCTAALVWGSCRILESNWAAGLLSWCCGIGVVDCA